MIGNDSGRMIFNKYLHIGSPVYPGGILQAFRQFPEKVLMTIKLNTLIDCGINSAPSVSYSPTFFTTKKGGNHASPKYIGTGSCLSAPFCPADHLWTARVPQT